MAMKRIDHLVCVGLAVAALSACSSVPLDQPANVPSGLKVPQGQRLTQTFLGSGVQIYTCQASQADPKRYEWAFKAPEANLLDNDGKQAGKHYAGPTWEALDGSKVVGEVKAKDAGPDAHAIPWLLLSAKSVSGHSVFGSTQYIQRLYTTSGTAPLLPCTAAILGSEERVPYTATYYFYTSLP
jgi:hypothetical protein